MSIPDLSALSSLAAHRRQTLRTTYDSGLTSGSLTPFLLPQALLGTFVLPVLYLSIPHARRPLLHRARFLVFAAVVASNLHLLRTASSASLAFSYAVGLLAAWGIMWSAALLLWMRPQFDLARVDTRPWRGGGGGGGGGGSRSRAGSAATQDGGLGPMANGVGGGASPGSPGPGPSCISNSSSSPGGHSRKRSDGTTRRRKSVRFMVAPDEDVARKMGECEYYWQGYPAEEPFMTRLGWCTDLVCAFRGCGWNWSIPSIPNFTRPLDPHASEPVNIESIPLSAPSGSTRFTTRSAFYRQKFLTLLLDYLVLDACSVLMMQDPYFILGPPLPPSTTAATLLPPHLASLPTPLLHTLRAILSFLGVLTVLHALFSLDQLVRLALLAPLGLFIRGPRADLWHYPTPFGSATQLLDRGLAGFWGRWWHQSFRGAFAAPGLALGLPPALAGLVAFVHSGCLHAAGAATAAGWRDTQPRGPFMFFVLAWVGVVAQEGLRAVAVGARPVGRDGETAGGLLLRARRLGNLAFVVGWLLLTQGMFVDDLARGGIWLLEPVPWSPLRAMGLGQPGDEAVRWAWEGMPRWYRGERWWQSGIAL